MFKQFPDTFSFPQLEKEILAFWEEHGIFKKSIDQRKGRPGFTFYEGPPTVNGKPGIHHVMSRTLKDMFCRYKTMTGFQVHRKAGWDTHGLPVEIALEKMLGFEQKSDIEKFGVGKFNREAKKLVYHHIDMKEGWRTLTERMGYWIDLDDAYITCTNEYIESVWWALSEYFKKGLIYKGFKIVPQCPHCETPLSSHELAQGYEEVQDQNLFVKFKARDEDASFLVWTTTPWTLISNVALAVHPEYDYVKVRIEGHGDCYLAAARLSVLTGDYEIIETMKGKELVNREYDPLFSYVPLDKKAHYIVPADFVTLEEGTGIVHLAPAFGADDYEMSKKYDLPFLQLVTEGGRFVDEVTDFAGRLVKTINFGTHEEKGCDPDIIRHLKERGLVYRASRDYRHTYPHCWRCDNPLIYYARDSWYIRTTAYAQKMIEINRTINWYPPEVGTGRFGNWLEENKDWALSRDRYWGTPLPIWVSEDGSDRICIGSIDELLEGWYEEDGTRRKFRREEVDLHKPFIDRVVFERGGKVYRRTPELIDVWFDSGAMPFAQFHYPFENQDWFEENFPADYICEGIDQTRGWFYTLHAISSFLFEKPAFKNLIVNELILDKTGQKMSKSKGNVVDPFAVLEQYGADATRWFLTVSSPPWRQKIFDEAEIEHIRKNFFRALVNTYQFFSMYANIDGWMPGSGSVAIEERPEIDRWILSELGALQVLFEERMENYDPTPAARAVAEFTIGNLSNWYVRRNRRRFWKGEMSKDKQSAYETLYLCMDTVVKLMAPFAPFLSEYLYQRLHESDQTQEYESVHLAYLPGPMPRDRVLERRGKLAQNIVAVTRNLREQARIKIRQPLLRILIATNDETVQQDINHFREVICEEINVKTIEFIPPDSAMIKKATKPNFKSLGPKYGKLVKAIAGRIRNLSTEEINAFAAEGKLLLTIDGQEIVLGTEDVEIVHEDIEGWLIGTIQGLVVALDTTLNDELIAEGLAREFVNRIQNLRKEKGFDVVDRINISYDTTSPTLQSAFESMKDYIQDETLATEFTRVEAGLTSATALDLNGEKCMVRIIKAE